MRAARGFVRWTAAELAEKSGVGFSTVRRAEMVDGTPSVTRANLEAIRRALEAAGIEFIAQNGGGPGVRLKDRAE